MVVFTAPQPGKGPSSGSNPTGRGSGGSHCSPWGLLAGGGGHQLVPSSEPGHGTVVICSTSSLEPSKGCGWPKPGPAWGRQTPKAPVMVLVVHAGIPAHPGGEAMWGGLQRPVGGL